MQLHRFRAGAPQVEVWAEDPALWGLPLTRELFAIASRIIDVRRLWRARAYPRGRRTDDPTEHQRFLATSCEGGYRGTFCKRDSCKQEPAIMHRVLSFLAAPGFDMPLYSDIFLHCVANGCRAQTVAVTSFFTMCDNLIRMSGRWQVAGRLSGQFARRPSACFEK